MKVDKREVEIRGRKLAYTYIQNQSDTVCFMLSGSSYTYDKPLFYYATMGMLEKRTDIVHIHYDYMDERLDLYDDKFAALVSEDVDAVIRAVLFGRTYSRMVVVAKSLGTLALGRRMFDDYPDAYFVILTPLLKKDSLAATLAGVSNKILIIIGDKDHHYMEETVKRVMEGEAKVTTIQEADHSLEAVPLDPFRSLTIMHQVITEITSFLYDE
ncbi:alpha/beta hydrolase [Halobacillus sp. KGW1]|uniref:alpha/beta hydrolase n=1 Tax=Halobacillus sp. KGW1 TaxID=1793726 RepID=UPI000786564C|nr:alpha/beta hydrolase [Halobacillus sp. KGW1]